MSYEIYIQAENKKRQTTTNHPIDCILLTRISGVRLCETKNTKVFFFFFFKVLGKVMTPSRTPNCRPR